jgi:NADH:ubiquinone oxidoreductase subunit 5 (subunit L)/multisubunit Na+/H+ antiporter MnhA subunit
VNVLSTWDYFLIISILLPLAAALLNYFVPVSRVRKGSVIITALVLIASRRWLHTRVGLTGYPELPLGGPNHPGPGPADPSLYNLRGFPEKAYLNDRAGYFAAVWGSISGIRDASQHPKVVFHRIDRLSVVMYLVVAVVGSIICIMPCGIWKNMRNMSRGGKRAFFCGSSCSWGHGRADILQQSLVVLFLLGSTTLCSFELIGHD